MFWVRKIVDDLWKIKNFKTFMKKFPHRFNKSASSDMFRESSQNVASIRFAAIYLNLYLQTMFNLCLSIFLAGQKAQGIVEAAKKLSGFNTSTSTLLCPFSHSHRNTLRKNAADYLRKVLFSFFGDRLKIKPAFSTLFPSINIRSFFFRRQRSTHTLLSENKILDDSRNKLLHFCDLYLPLNLK